jgi:hypothetical protein
MRRDEPDNRNPLLRSLMWMLVGIGLVGLVLFGAQKFLFNRNTEPAATPVETQVQAPVQGPATPAPDTPAAPAAGTGDSASKPSPVGEAKASEETAKQAPKPEPSPKTTAPETAKREAASPEKPSTSLPNETPRDRPPDAARDTPAREVSSIPSPVVARPGGPQTVQFLTDPPGAQVIIDNNSSLACKSPCLLPVPPGRHVLNIQLAGYRAYPRVFNVPQDGDIFLQLNKIAASLSVTSTPPGATIEINGEMQTKRTPSLFSLSPGTYHLRVARNGALLDFDVQLHDGEFVSRNVNF